MIRCECGHSFEVEDAKPLTHRLLCGDSMDAGDVGDLMRGETADLCFTSPPYAQQRDYKQKIDDWDGLMEGVFANIPANDKTQVLVNLGLIHRDGEWIPYWEGWIEWMRSQGWRRFGWYVWDKGQSGRAEGCRLPTEHEFIFHFSTNGVKPEKVEKCKRAGASVSVPSKYSGPEGQHRLRDKRSIIGSHKVRGSVCHVFRNPGSGIDHPAPYPVEFAAYWVGSWPGRTYEPFAGSGTTAVACEQLGRECRMIEIDPGYVAVALERMTGMGCTVEVVE